MKRYWYSCLATFVMLSFNSCSTNPVTGKKEVILVSKEQENAMGQQSDPEIINYFGVYQDAKLQQFINEKGKAMGAISHRPELNYTFKVVDSPVINAFAVPGGYVYFTRGIMAHFNNEAEFAGVLGHEIGHVTARHSAQQQSKAMLAQIGMVVGMVVAPELGQFAQAAQQGVGLLFLKFGRDDERESDRLGVEYSTRIGYDATEMAKFFTTLERQSSKSDGEKVPNFLSTHPAPAERLETVGQYAAEWKQKTGATNLKVNRDQYLRLIDGIILGEDPKQGFVENNVFYHPVMKFQFPIPAGWQVQNTPQMVQMAPQGGKAMMMMTLAQGTNVQAAAQQIAQQYSLQVRESKEVSVNGLPALAMVADQQPQQQGQGQQTQGQQTASVRALIYLIQYGGNIYNMMGVSTLQDFNSYANVFTASMQNFKQLTDQSKLNRQPERVRIKTVPQTGTLSQVLRSFQMPDKRLEELALLNGMALTDQVTKGSLIKVVDTQ
ncbi:M48 family metalloprotease [Adhaeribacter aquaticus]|uniref:M48 family metalloprotease n=1 Tax=Adhaeribacter aquaticus TaxID=299567 RepID=UPI00047A1E7C|nr:M48 family metalloprotease [Adhaeribacter aquaticus]